MDETTPGHVERPSFLSISPLSLLAMLWKRKVSILILYSVLGAISLAVVVNWPDRYRSETVILVDGQKIPDTLVAATVNKELQDRIATISKQILSSTNLMKVIDTFGLYKETRTHMVQEE